MLKVVLDTNLFVSSLLSKSGRTAVVLPLPLTAAYNALFGVKNNDIAHYLAPI